MRYKCQDVLRKKPSCLTLARCYVTNNIPWQSANNIKTTEQSKLTYYISRRESFRLT